MNYNCKRCGETVWFDNFIKRVIYECPECGRIQEIKR